VCVCAGREPGATTARERGAGADIWSLLRREDHQQRHRRHDPRAAEERRRRLHAAAVGPHQLGLLTERYDVHSFLRFVLRSISVHDDDYRQIRAATCRRAA